MTNSPRVHLGSSVFGKKPPLGEIYNRVLKARSSSSLAQTLKIRTMIWLFTVLIIMAFGSQAVMATGRDEGTNDSQSGKEPKVSIFKAGDKENVVGNVVLNAAPQKVWVTLTDYENAPKIFKNLYSCKVVIF